MHASRAHKLAFDMPRRRKPLAFGGEAMLAEARSRAIALPLWSTPQARAEVTQLLGQSVSMGHAVVAMHDPDAAAPLTERTVGGAYYSGCFREIRAALR